VMDTVATELLSWSTTADIPTKDARATAFQHLHTHRIYLKRCRWLILSELHQHTACRSMESQPRALVHSAPCQVRKRLEMQRAPRLFLMLPRMVGAALQRCHCSAMTSSWRSTFRRLVVPAAAARAVTCFKDPGAAPRPALLAANCLAAQESAGRSRSPQLLSPAQSRRPVALAPHLAASTLTPCHGKSEPRFRQQVLGTAIREALR